MCSPFAVRFNTNYVPSDDEVQKIRQYLRDPIDQLSRLDSEIARIQAILDNLHGERNKLNAQIKSHRALISPVRRLPQDVLQEIFVACLPSDRNAVMSAEEVPVLLGHICSAWRNVSHLTPRLWSSIHITIPVHNSNISKLYERHETAKTWLGRSGVCPLSISLQCGELPPDPLGTKRQAGVLKDVVQTLLSFSLRWRHISFDIPLLYLSMLSPLSGYDTPLVESLKVSCRLHWGGIFDWKILGILQGPRLCNLTINFVNDGFFNLPIRWSALTEVDLETQSHGNVVLSVDNVLTLANMCPNLVTCRILINGGDESHHDVSQYSVTLPQLQTLFLVDYSDATDLFKMLNMPSLHHVTYSGRNSPAGHPAPLVTLLSRPAHLQSLTFDWMEGQSKEELLECLELVPFVTELHVVMLKWSTIESPSILDDDCLRRFLLTSTNIGECLCPRLESLDCTNASFSEELLFRFIEERGGIPGSMHPDIAPLKRVCVRFDRPRMVDAMHAEHQPLTTPGVDVTLEYQNASDALNPWFGLPKVTPTLQRTAWGWS